MYFREPTEAKPLRIRDNPMHRTYQLKTGSSSVSAIIHGDPSVKSNHYVDGKDNITQPSKDLKEIMQRLIDNKGIIKDR